MRAIIVGGAGFIGSHFVDLISDPVIYDLAKGHDARDTLALVDACNGCDTLIHLASNADIAKAAKYPMTDFDCGTAITASVVEAARLSKIKTIVYASGSGVYGDRGTEELRENDPTIPTSPYGASKIAGEALVAAYCHMFDIRGISFRFANVVGAGQTHGVGYDFMNHLRSHPPTLTVLGNGEQSKSYIHVDDVWDAVLTGMRHVERYDVFNVASSDTMTVAEIAEMAVNVSGSKATIEYGTTPGGWAGDIPHVRLNTDKIRSLGWLPRWPSNEAMWIALEGMK